MTEYFQKIDASSAFTQKEAGGKADKVRMLAGISGIRIPDSFLLKSKALEDYVLVSIDLEELASLVDAYYQEGNRLDLFAELAHLDFPGFLWQEIKEALEGIPLVIVRSSGTMEDSAAKSLAGHYESILTHTNKKDLIFTIKTCWMVGLKVFFDQIAPGLEEKDPLVLVKKALNSIALLIQIPIPSEKSGVYFSSSPIEPGRHLITANYGTCHSVVDGGMATDTWSLKDGRIDSSSIRFKFEFTAMIPKDEVLPGSETKTPLGPAKIHFPYGEFLYSARLPARLSRIPVLNPAEIKELYETALKIKEKMGFEIDMEWTYAENKLYVLQVRPITTAPPVRKLASKGPEYLTASAGRARGPVKIVLSANELGLVEEGDIIAVKATDPDYMPILYRAAGIISEEGSPLCHTAIVARELEIPCILGVRGATRGMFRMGEKVVLDADRCIISKTEVPAPIIVKKGFDRNETIYSTDDLKYHRGEKVTLTLSGLLTYFHKTNSLLDYDRETLIGLISDLKEKYGLEEVMIRIDVNDDKNVFREKDRELADFISLVEGRSF